MPTTIRPATAADLDACYDICLRTGRSGEDATGMYADPTLLGSVYAGPYLLLREGLGFVATAADAADPADPAGAAGVGSSGSTGSTGTVLGYVLGTADTRAFEAACEEHWWPSLRARQPDPGSAPTTPDDRLRRLIHHPPLAPEEVVRTHPAHLHIDLDPRLQGAGSGRALIERFTGALAERRVPGVHLGVARANERAIGFYRHLGFETLQEQPDALVLGLRLRGILR